VPAARVGARVYDRCRSDKVCDLLQQSRQIQEKAQDHSDFGFKVPNTNSETGTTRLARARAELAMTKGLDPY
jgi:hypothetical protein